MSLNDDSHKATGTRNKIPQGNKKPKNIFKTVQNMDVTSSMAAPAQAGVQVSNNSDPTLQKTFAATAGGGDGNVRVTESQSVLDSDTLLREVMVISGGLNQLSVQLSQKLSKIEFQDLVSQVDILKSTYQSYKFIVREAGNNLEKSVGVALKYNKYLIRQLEAQVEDILVNQRFSDSVSAPLIHPPSYEMSYGRKDLSGLTPTERGESVNMRSNSVSH